MASIVLDTLGAALGSIGSLPYLPFASYTPIFSVLRLSIQLLTPRTIEDDIILFRTRSQHVGSLSAVSAFLASVQAQFLTLTFQKNETKVQNVANICFLMGVIFNVMGAAMSSFTFSNLPDLASVQKYFEDYQKAIEEAESFLDHSQAANPDISLDLLAVWERTHRHKVSQMFKIRLFIASWNIQSFILSIVMINGVASFFLGLIFFVLDNQPRVVWISTLLIAIITYALIITAQELSSCFVRFRSFVGHRRPGLKDQLRLAAESETRMREREKNLETVYALALDIKKGSKRPQQPIFTPWRT